VAAIDGQEFARTVQPNGSVVVDRRSYYLKQSLAGRKVVLVVKAKEARVPGVPGEGAGEVGRHEGFGGPAAAL
jgi:hypothetical protein